MTPQERREFEQLKTLVQELLTVQNVEFIKNLERRLNFLSGSFVLSDASDVTSTSPTSGQVLEWNGTAWAPATDNI